MLSMGLGRCAMRAAHAATVWHPLTLPCSQHAEHAVSSVVGVLQHDLRTSAVQKRSGSESMGHGRAAGARRARWHSLHGEWLGSRKEL